MTDKEFLEKIYGVAEQLRERSLTELEKTSIIEYFNAGQGSSFEKAKYAIKKVTGQIVPDSFRAIESTGSINNLQILVAEMKTAAEKWSKSKNE